MNKKLTIILLFSAICILLSTTAISAVNDNQDVQTDTSYQMEINDNNNLNTISKDNNKQLKEDTMTVSDYNQLKSSMDKKKNQTFNLEKKTYTVNSQIIVEGQKTLTINGNGATLDAKNQKTGFINFAATNLQINNITFKNFQCENNAVIMTSSKSNATITNCHFINIVGKDRGAMINKYNLNLINCTFENVQATNGAAISLIGNNGKITIDKCTFKNSPSKTPREPLISSTGNQTVTVKNSLFENNKGRAIHNYLDSNITISNNKFINTNNSYTSVLQGALITNYEANMYIYNNTFNNLSYTAPRIGGGLMYNEIGTFKMIGNNFTKINLVQTGQDRIAGGIVWTRNSTATIDKNIFDLTSKSYNIAGGVIYNNIGNATVTNNSFTQKATVDNEVAGVTIYNDYDPAIKVNSRLTYGDNSFSDVTLTKTPKTIVEKIIRNKGIIKLIGSENKVFNKTANIKVTAPASAQTGTNATFTVTVTDATTNQKLDGTAIIKIDGITLTDANGKNILLKVTNGQAKLSYSLRGYSARMRNITAVFSKVGYSRAEAKTTMMINKVGYAPFSFVIDGCSEKVITLNKTLKDANGNVLGGNNKIAIKVGDRTVISTSTVDGKLNVKFTLPYLPEGKFTVTVTLGNNYRYNMLKFNTTATIHKQNVTVTINNITAKAGQKIQVTAQLLNAETKTKVISGKYIFKVNGKTVPLIDKNGQEISTTKIVSNGIAQWDYTLPSNLKKGTYEILLAYNGNTQSNPVKYGTKALTITA